MLSRYLHSIRNNFRLDKSQTGVGRRYQPQLSEVPLHMVFWSSFESCVGILHQLWSTFSNFKQQSVEGVAAIEGKSVVNAFVSHVFTKNSGVCSQSRHCHANIIVHLEHLLLVAGQFRGQSLKTAQDLYEMKEVQHEYRSADPGKCCLV